MSSETHSPNSIPDGPPQQCSALMAAGKFKQAVELAKEHHKRLNTPESESLLVDAYLGRIGQFQQKGALADAATLIKLVHDRFPRQRHRLAPLQAGSAAALGDVGSLVAPLARPDTPKEVKETIEAAILRELIDLPALAAAPQLGAEHPLRIAATATWRAFQAVTSGPVRDEQIALPEVSRRSPLAGWKMLIRAIAAFHRHDDEACRRALEQIPPDAAVRVAGPFMQSMMVGQPLKGPKTTALAVRILGGSKSIQQALAAVEKSRDTCDLVELRRALAAAIDACRASYPELVEQLRQRLWAWCAAEDVPADAMLFTIGVVRRNAAFWRQHASLALRDSDPLAAAMGWERFLRHAIHEGMFPAQSPEAGVVWLHAADLLDRLPPDEWRFRPDKSRCARTIRKSYADQPPEIAALAPTSDGELIKLMDAGRLYAQSARCYPDVDTFRRWYRWASCPGQPPRLREEPARAWHAAFPADPEPLILLSAEAEDRQAFKTALDYLEEAEQRDKLNPLVRRARLRLTLSTLWRHFKQEKAHLVEKDLARLAQLPGLNEGDGPAFLLAVRSVWRALRREEEAARQTFDEAVQSVGLGLAWIFLATASQMSALRLATSLQSFAREVEDLPPEQVVPPLLRAIRIGQEFSLALYTPARWLSSMADFVRRVPCPVPPADLRALGHYAIGGSEPVVAYAVSAAGLASTTGPAAAPFLLLRAQALRQRFGIGRPSQCLQAAQAVARQLHDTKLLDEIGREMDLLPELRYPRSRGGDEGRGLSGEVIEQILQAERQAGTFPRNWLEAQKAVVLLPAAEAPFDDWNDDEDENDDCDGGDDDFDEDAPFVGADQTEADEGPFALFPDAAPPAARSPADKSVQDMMQLLRALLNRFGLIPSTMQLQRDAPELARQLSNKLPGGSGLDEFLAAFRAMQENMINNELDDPGGRSKRRRPRRRGH